MRTEITALLLLALTSCWDDGLNQSGRKLSDLTPGLAWQGDGVVWLSDDRVAFSASKYDGDIGRNAIGLYEIDVVVGGSPVEVDGSLKDPTICLSKNGDIVYLKRTDDTRGSLFLGRHISNVNESLDVPQSWGEACGRIPDARLDPRIPQRVQPDHMYSYPIPVYMVRAFNGRNNQGVADYSIWIGDLDGANFSEHSVDWSRRLADHARKAADIGVHVFPSFDRSLAAIGAYAYSQSDLRVDETTGKSLLPLTQIKKSYEIVTEFFPLPRDFGDAQISVRPYRDGIFLLVRKVTGRRADYEGAWVLRSDGSYEHLWQGGATPLLDPVSPSGCSAIVLGRASAGESRNVAQPVYLLDLCGED